MKSHNKFEGIIVPHITPFTKKGEIDFEALRVCARFWIENGVDVVVTPYYFKVSNRELTAHYKAVLEAVDLPIILYSVPSSQATH